MCPCSAASSAVQACEYLELMQPAWACGNAIGFHLHPMAGLLELLSSELSLGMCLHADLLPPPGVVAVSSRDSSGHSGSFGQEQAG